MNDLGQNSKLVDFSCINFLSRGVAFLGLEMKTTPENHLFSSELGLTFKFACFVSSLKSEPLSFEFQVGHLHWTFFFWIIIPLRWLKVPILVFFLLTINLLPIPQNSNRPAESASSKSPLLAVYVSGITFFDDWENMVQHSSLHWLSTA